MIKFIFTLDYEIYGNGTGTLRELVLDPTKRMGELFAEFGAPFVVFAEALEFQKIEEQHTDADISEVRAQLRDLRAKGHEIGLHLHPWWANARLENGSWRLDWNERNLCTAAPERIDQIVREAIDYLRDALGDPGFSPVSFRNGLWLMQPTLNIARALARHGIKIDSSVFKGGVTRELGLDYRPALRNGASWWFSNDVNVEQPQGLLRELPIHTEMVPFWKMLRRKRLGLHRKVPAAPYGTPVPSRWRDYLRLTYPRKLDFCRMSFDELRAAMAPVLQQDTLAPAVERIIVAIGHSKDLVDFETLRSLLSYLQDSQILVTSFDNELRHSR
jgi:hypothetical protein